MDNRPDLLAAVAALLAPRYSILREIGRGATAVVYLAEDSKHLRRVAIKVLRPELAHALGPDRFLREIRIAAAITHPNIIGVFDSGQVAGTLYYVMPFVEGESLRAKLDREGVLPLAEIAAIVNQVASALEHAHSEQIVHRDLKPENILVAQRNAWVTDFGVARAFAEASAGGLTEPGLAVGTPWYMSPEQAAADPEIDGRSDLYSLAVVAYEMMTGVPPFREDGPRAALARKLAEPVPPIRSINNKVSAAVEAVVMRGLARDPAERFNSATEMARALERACASGALPDRADGAAAVGRRRYVRPVTAALVILMVGWWSTSASDAEGPRVPDRSIGWTLLAEVEGSAPEEVRSTLGSILRGQIDESGRIARLPESQVSLGLQGMLLPDSARLTYRVARELAVRAAIPAIIAPVLDRVGTTYAITLRVRNPRNDSLISAFQSNAETDDELLQAAAVAAERAVSSIAMLPTTLYGRWPPLITSSTAAYKKWDLGFRHINRNERDLAREAFADALELDPEFAAASCWLGLVQSEDGLMQAADSSFAHTFRHSERLSDFYVGMCETFFAAHRGDMESVLRYTRRTAAEYNVNHSNIAVALALLGRHEEAIASLEGTWREYPFGPPDREVRNLARWLMQAGHHDRALTVLAPLPDNEAQRQLLARIAVYKGDWDTAEEMVQTSIRHLPVSKSIAAEVHVARGRIRAAYDEVASARAGATPGPALSPIDAYEVALLVSIASGVAPITSPVEGVMGDTSIHARMLRAIASLQFGDPTPARSVLESSSEVPLEDPASARDRSNICLRRVLEGRERFYREDWQTAISLLKGSSCQLDDRGGRVYRLAEWTIAEAFEAAGQADSAAARFSAIGYNRPVYRAFNTPHGFTHPFALRRAALLYGRLGENDRAADHWRTLLASFTDPDAEFSAWRDEAERELTRLAEHGIGVPEVDRK